MKAMTRIIIIAAALLAAASCEDTITTQISTDVFLAGLPEYTLTILQPGNGSVTPSGAQTVKKDQPLQIAVTLPGSGGYIFLYWQKVTGAGAVTFGSSTAASTTVSLSGGDATIQPVVTDTPRTLTMQNDTHGYTSPVSSATLANGVAYQIHAYPYPTYAFNNWTVPSGTATFSSTTDPNATVTLSVGDATIRANFRKETVSLTALGYYDMPDNTTFPYSCVDLYLYNGYLYVFGKVSSGSSNSVISRFNVSNSSAPSIGPNDYCNINGYATALVGTGTYLYAGSADPGGDIRRIAISGFGPSSTLVTLASAQPVVDLTYNPNPVASAFVWANTGTKIEEISGSATSLNTGYYIINSSGYDFTHIRRTPYGLLSVIYNGGALGLATYDLNTPLTPEPYTWNAPTDEMGIATGDEMDTAGDAWMISLHPDGDRGSVPIFNGTDGTYYLRNFACDDATWVPGFDSVQLPGPGVYTAQGEYYAFIASNQGTDGHIYVVDQSTWISPELRSDITTTGYQLVDAVALSADGNYLYAILRNPASAKPRLQIYQIVRN